MEDLVLASTSKYRRELLERLGIPFRCCAPLVDEEAMQDSTWQPTELAERLAMAKACSVGNRERAATVIGSDQVAACGGLILGKPGTRERAIQQLTQLSGQTHQLFTSVCVWRAGTTWLHTDRTNLKMRPLSQAEIERYVDADIPVDCAGSYKLEQRGICLFEEIQSADHSAITGLPLIALTTTLRELGFAVP